VAISVKLYIGVFGPTTVRLKLRLSFLANTATTTIIPTLGSQVLLETPYLNKASELEILIKSVPIISDI
jgi:hypothetical protein